MAQLTNRVEGAKSRVKTQRFNLFLLNLVPLLVSKAFGFNHRSLVGINHSHGPIMASVGDFEEPPKLILLSAKHLHEGPNNPNSVGNEDLFCVKWDKDDPQNPVNFSPWTKKWLLLQMTFLATVSSFGSSVSGPAGMDIAAYLRVSQEVIVLDISLFMLGWAFRPMLWAPIGEVYGRKASMLPAVFVMSLFSIGSGTSTTTSALFTSGY